MESVVFIVLGLVVAIVSIDAIARLERRDVPRPKKKDEAVTTTQKIIVDLTRRL